MGNDCGTHIIGTPGQTGEKYYTGPVFDCAVEYSVHVVVEYLKEESYEDR